MSVLQDTFLRLSQLPAGKRAVIKSHEESDFQLTLMEKRRLSVYLDEMTKKHVKKLQKVKLDYIFCNDAYLLQMNKEFLNHDTLTDIITFDLAEYEDELVGEIYISTERVAENAAKFNVSYNEELHRVIFHGALHLCGYKDKTTADKEQMRKLENKCLAAYF